jgi:4a-hydroxytetrahydrobiopterin dehydratase
MDMDAMSLFRGRPETCRRGGKTVTRHAYAADRESIIIRPDAEYRRMENPMKRSASTVWQDGLKDGKGRISPKESQRLAGSLQGWKQVGGKSLRQEFVMKDFMAAVKFIGAIAGVAESEQHHPDLHLTDYRNLAIELSTHDAGGLTVADFTVARGIDALPRKLKHGRARRK